MRFYNRFLKTPSVTRWMVLITTSILFVRVFVLFCESYSSVSSERVSDNELLELCKRGAAAESTKFRQLCSQTKSERAAPLFLKAILKALRTTFLDFIDSVNSPTKIAILLLFCLSGLALPIVKATTSLATAYLGPNSVERHIHEDDYQPDCEVVVLNDPRRRTRWPLSNSLSRFPGRQRLTLNNIVSNEDEEDHDWKKISLGA